MNDSDRNPGRWREHWIPLLEFLVHVLVGTTLFVGIAIPAVLLNLSVQWLASSGLNVSNLILVGLEVAEYAVFGLDLLLLIVYLLRTTLNMATKIWEHRS
jgi:hypothetical protein